MTAAIIVVFLFIVLPSSHCKSAFLDVFFTSKNFTNIVILLSKFSLPTLWILLIYLWARVVQVSFALQLQPFRQLQLASASEPSGFYSGEISGNTILCTQRYLPRWFALTDPEKRTSARPYLPEICTSSREWVTFRPPDHSESQLFFLLASAERKEMEAGKWSWREPGRSEMRRASMC